MSHIPASKMPHATADDATDTVAAPPETLATMPAQSSAATFAGTAPADTGPAATTAPASGPEATASNDDATGTTRPTPASPSDSGFSTVALAIGGLVAVGAIAAAVLPFLTEDKDKKPKKGGKKKKRADA